MESDPPSENIRQRRVRFPERIRRDIPCSGGLHHQLDCAADEHKSFREQRVVVRRAAHGTSKNDLLYSQSSHRGALVHSAMKQRAPTNSPAQVEFMSMTILAYLTSCALSSASVWDRDPRTLLRSRRLRHTHRYRHCQDRHFLDRVCSHLRKDLVSNRCSAVDRDCRRRQGELCDGVSASRDCGSLTRILHRH